MSPHRLSQYDSGSVLVNSSLVFKPKGPSTGSTITLQLYQQTITKLAESFLTRMILD